MSHENEKVCHAIYKSGEIISVFISKAGRQLPDMGLGHCKTFVFHFISLFLISDDVETKDVEKFWEEFEILKNLDPHVHVVGLKGIVTKHVPLPLLVVEYCDGGDLQTHLRKVINILTTFLVTRTRSVIVISHLPCLIFASRYINIHENANDASW